MRFLADENVWGSLIHALLSRGHEVVSAKIARPGSPDEHWLAHAAATESILLTEDNDFGHLVFATGRTAFGVILIPFGLFKGDRKEIAEELARRIDDLAPSLADRWTVLGPKRTRQRPLRRIPLDPDTD